MAVNEHTPSFKDTLNLPRTTFAIRPSAAIDDPALVARWEENKLYQKACEAHDGGPRYILHVGPPFPNGHIHLGHAYNGILKDIITKSYRMSGYYVPVTPGWDCHGLPVEIKIVQTTSDLSRLEIKKACRTYAEHWVKVQAAEFKRLGIVMDWDRAYLTMAPPYESMVVRAFGQLFNRGFLSRKNKTVAWCFSCKTVLAAAEIEYKDRKDPSIYVLFPIDDTSCARLFPEASGRPVSLLVWTTTPWTLPLNRAVVLKSGASYVLADIKGHLVVLGQQTIPLVEQALQAPVRVIKSFFSDYLADARVKHLFVDDATALIFDDMVSVDEGTACVHCAPGCGPIDYEWAVKNNLEIYSPLTDDGRYARGIIPADLEGVLITDAQGKVITKLVERGLLLHKSSLAHSYPHCWRCHNGLMFRATRQWFFDLGHNDVKKRALDAIERIEFLPPQGRNFLRATIESRWEWCLSRQRSWGVPIPALLCSQCDAVYCTPSFVEHVARAIEQEGNEYWERVTLDELLSLEDVRCSVCCSKDLIKDADILDVWFDSGLSHHAVLQQYPGLSFPADLYLEGIDQHRGWFQSSLITAIALEGAAPMKAIMTHGFTVDEKGQKMSKSLGNVVAPDDVLKRLGTDGLRLWVSSIGNDGDAVYSEKSFEHVGEVFRKIRNTARFLLANLYDFDSDYDRIPVGDLLLLDRALLAYLHELNTHVIEWYHAGDMTAVFHALADFCTVQLSSWYLDIVKDRLYVEKANGHLRRSAQTACWYALDTLTRLMAPIMSFTAEQLSDLYQKDKASSIHLQCFAKTPNIWADDVSTMTSLWEYIRMVRDLVLKALEGAREKGIIKHSLEARVMLFADPRHPDYDFFARFCALLATSLQTREAFFKEFFIVSQLEFVERPDDLVQTVHDGWFVRIEHAHGAKCPRCWNWDSSPQRDQLCRRCYAIVDDIS